jgi:DNA polymerase III epsilon subunit-like protein
MQWQCFSTQQFLGIEFDVWNWVWYCHRFLKLILKMYAILDIENGGAIQWRGITEIAIYKFDGHEIVDQFISLVNPNSNSTFCSDRYQ